MFKRTPLEDEVIARLDEDPRIADSGEIAVVGDGAIITLRGTVQRFSQRRAAEDDARGVEGVSEVINHLKVNLLAADHGGGGEIRGA
jgi:osmotically-inducible protein OsmY